jgi:hypothetical protein
MVILLLTLNTAMASSIVLESSSSDVPTNIKDSRDRLLAQISHYRQGRMASSLTDGEDYVLLSSFGEIPRTDSLLKVPGHFRHF